jgi:hypothetical protein
MAAPQTVIIGRKSTTPDDHFGDMGASEIRAYVANNAPADAWIRRARYRGGRITGSTPRVRVAVYDTAGGGPAPDDLIYTFPNTYPSERMDDANGGELVTVNVDSTTKAFLVAGGLNYALGLQVNDASFRHNMIEAADISGENEQFYYKSASNPPNPYGASTVSTEGWITLWLEGDQNLAPLIPINISPSGQTLSITPTLEADFRDPNGTYGATAYGTAGNFDAGDYCASARVKVRRKSDAVSFWDHTYTTTSGERAANRTSKVYAGTTLVRGTVYQVQWQHFDRNGDSSPVSAWVDFTPGSLGVVTTTGIPTGKVDDTTPDVAWSWFHGTGLSADRVRVKFYRGNASTPSATSSDMTVSVASGAGGSALWSSMGIGTALIPGELYYYTVEARATDLVWSQPSAKRSFTVDAAPGVPTNLSPATGEIRSTSTYPVLSAKITDADDTNATGLAGTVEILDSGGSLIQTRAATLRAGTTDIYDYQTVAADLAAPGTYRHRWYSFDGYLYSGGVTSSGSASRSAEAVFSWAAVPSPVITAPIGGSSLATVQPVIQWTVASQDKFRARILENGVEVFSSGEISNTAAREYTFPVGYTKNGHTYDFELGVQFSTLWGYDTETAVLIDYVEPASAGNFQVLPGTVNLEPIPTAAVGTWDAYIGDYFDSYTIYRDDLGDRPYLEIRNAALTTFTDYHAPNNAVYTIVVNEMRGLDELVASEPVSVNVTIGIRGVVMVSLDNPQVDRYVNLAWESVEWTAQGEESTYFTWGAEKPISKRGVAEWFEGAQEFKLNSEIVDPQVARAALESLARSTGFSYRDRYDRKFAQIPAGSLQMSRVRGVAGDWAGSFDLREVEVIEGVIE